MGYFHLRIDYFDTMLHGVQTRFCYDVETEEDLYENYLLPFIKNETLFFNGSFIDHADIRSIKVYESNFEMSNCLDFANAKVPSNVYYVYTNENILGEKDFVPEVTKDKFDKLRHLMREQKNTINMSKKRKLFISHSTSDVNCVEELVNLLEFLGLNPETMVCSSMDGYGVPLGENIFEYLKQQFLESELFVIFLHSPAYYRSAICLNEMGAAWVSKTEYCSFLLPGFEFEDMKGVVDKSKISIKIGNSDTKARMFEFKEKIEKFFSLENHDHIVWNRKCDKFLSNIGVI